MCQELGPTAYSYYAPIQGREVLLGAEGIKSQFIKMGYSILGLPSLPVGRNSRYGTKTMAKRTHRSPQLLVAATVAGTTRNFALYVGFGTVGFTSNIILNIYATIFITTRLLLHRRIVMACAQDKALTAQHIYIIGILLESAVVNLPITIVTAVWIGSPLEQVALPISAASQVS